MLSHALLALTVWIGVSQADCHSEQRKWTTLTRPSCTQLTLSIPAKIWGFARFSIVRHPNWKYEQFVAQYFLSFGWGPRLHSNHSACLLSTFIDMGFEQLFVYFVAINSLSFLQTVGGVALQTISRLKRRQENPQKVAWKSWNRKTYNVFEVSGLWGND